MNNLPGPVKIKGLVVDDEKIILIYLKRLLSTWGYVADTANTSQEAIEIIKKRDYDFIMLDIRMPDINGEQLYNMIAEVKPYLVNRIIIITGDISNKSTASFFKETKAPILTKPIDSGKLKDTIDKTISNQ